MVWDFSHNDGYSTVYLFFLMLGWETRKGMTLKRVSEIEMSWKVETVEKLTRSVRLLSCFSASLKLASQEAPLTQNRRIEGL